MTLKLKLLYRVVRRRVERGEDLSEVLKDYPRLTAEQRAEIVGVERSIKTDIKQDGASPFFGGAAKPVLSENHKTRRVY